MTGIIPIIIIHIIIIITPHIHNKDYRVDIHINHTIMIRYHYHYFGYNSVRRSTENSYVIQVTIRSYYGTTVVVIGIECGREILLADVCWYSVLTPVVTTSTSTGSTVVSRHNIPKPQGEPHSIQTGPIGYFDDVI